MHSDLPALCGKAREQIAVPPFPRAAIRAAAQNAPNTAARRRSFFSAVALGLSLVAVAAAADIAVQSHIRFTPSGGFVISSSAKMASRAIHSNAEVRAAAQHLNFPVVLPAGLPDGTRPTQLFTAGNDMLAVTYELPGAWRASHHHLWIFLINPASIGKYRAPLDRYRLHPGGRGSEIGMWQVGGEQVIAVSNGLTRPEVERMKAAMQREIR
jgi:hypothetical protein